MNTILSNLLSFMRQKNPLLFLIIGGILVGLNWATGQNEFSLPANPSGITSALLQVLTAIALLLTNLKEKNPS